MAKIMRWETALNARARLTEVLYPSDIAIDSPSKSPSKFYQPHDTDPGYWRRGAG